MTVESTVLFETEMTVESTLHFEAGINVKDILACLAKLPEPIKPVYFTENEGRIPKQNVLLNKTRFQQFLSNNSLGFYTYAGNKKNSFDISTWDTDRTDVTLWLETGSAENLVPAFIKCLAGFEPVFGFGCELQEYYHRNRHYMAIGATDIKSWIGRNYNKKIPGVYWYTLLSDELLDRHNVVLSDLSAEAMTCEALGDGSLHLLKFFENAKDWQDNAGNLDRLCEQTHGVFSKKSVAVALSDIRDMRDYNEKIRDFR